MAIDHGDVTLKGQAARTHLWEDVIDDTTAEVYRRYGRSKPIEAPFALLCIDNYNAVFGDHPQPILEAIGQFPMSCGLAGWQALEPTKALIARIRGLGAPIVHTTSAARASSARNATRRVERGAASEWSHEFRAELAPESGEIVLPKAMASAFFGTDLGDRLVGANVRDVIVCGNTTSGCVRATAVDAYNLGLNVTIPEECVFDRSPLSHKVNLFDLNAKYASVRFLDEVLEELASVAVGLSH